MPRSEHMLALTWVALCPVIYIIMQLQFTFLCYNEICVTRASFSQCEDCHSFISILLCEIGLAWLELVCQLRLRLRASTVRDFCQVRGVVVRGCGVPVLSSDRIGARQVIAAFYGTQDGRTGDQGGLVPARAWERVVGPSTRLLQDHNGRVKGLQNHML